MKTLRINDDIHEMILDKIEEIKCQYGLRITMESIADSILRNGILNYNIAKLINETAKGK